MKNYDRNEAFQKLVKSAVEEVQLAYDRMEEYSSEKLEELKETALKNVKLSAPKVCIR